MKAMKTERLIYLGIGYVLALAGIIILWSETNFSVCLAIALLIWGNNIHQSNDFK